MAEGFHNRLGLSQPGGWSLQLDLRGYAPLSPGVPWGAWHPRRSQGWSITTLPVNGDPAAWLFYDSIENFFLGLSRGALGALRGRPGGGFGSLLRFF